MTQTGSNEISESVA